MTSVNTIQIVANFFFSPVETEDRQNLYVLLLVNKPASIFFFQIFIDTHQQPSRAAAANRLAGCKHINQVFLAFSIVKLLTCRVRVGIERHDFRFPRAVKTKQKQNKNKL